MQKLAEFLRTEMKGRDHIHIVGQIIPNGEKYHFEVEEGVLKGVAKTVAARRQRAAQRSQD